MRRILASTTIGCLLIAGLALAKSVSLTGTWECVAHGFDQGDVNFTLYLTQNPDNSITGWVASPMGSADLASVTFKDNRLDMRINSHQGTYHLNGNYEVNRFSGTWSRDSTASNGSSAKGQWEGKKTSDSPDPK